MPIGTISITIVGNLQTTDFISFINPADLVPIGGTDQLITLYSAEKLVTTTVNGSGFGFDEDGNLTSGTVTSIVSTGPGGASVSLTGAAFGAAALSAAAAGLAAGDPTDLQLLLNDYGLIYDATQSDGPVEEGFADFLGPRTIIGSPRADTLGVDTASSTTVRGGKGGDFILAYASSETDPAGSFFGGYGNDTISMATFNSEAFGGAGNDVFLGDFLFGLSGSGNRLLGGAGDDMFLFGQFAEATINRLRGGEGDDTVFISGNGRARVFGGDGADRFIFEVGFSPRLSLRDFDVTEDVLIMKASAFAAGMKAEDVVTTYGQLSAEGFAQLVIDGSIVTLRNISSLDNLADVILLVDDAYVDGLLA
jgi:RTX calcium-binding nonapeptide repeat (4 copies)